MLFDRRATVVVDGVRVEGLRIAFRVSKSLGKEPNTMDLTVTNLSASTRASIARTLAPVVLSAGYADSEAVIFRGDARTVIHTHEGVDWNTRVQCGDGERAYAFARMSESFAPGTSIVDVVRKCAAALGLNVGNLPDMLARGSFRGDLTQYAHGYTSHGRASAELDKVLRSAGFEWSIQDGALQVLKGTAPVQGDAVLLSPDSGMIGSPDHGTPAVKGGKPPIKVRSLLQPTIRCGGVVEVRSAGVQGQYRVAKVEHTGDTHGAEWYTTIEATQV
jgi:hypothetical protein